MDVILIVLALVTSLVSGESLPADVSGVSTPALENADIDHQGVGRLGDTRLER
jgi:hypothetical protein